MKKIIKEYQKAIKENLKRIKRAKKTETKVKYLILNENFKNYLKQLEAMEN